MGRETGRERERERERETHTQRHIYTHIISICIYTHRHKQADLSMTMKPPSLRVLDLFQLPRLQDLNTLLNAAQAFRLDPDVEQSRY